jgi:hypothetical protein
MFKKYGILGFSAFVLLAIGCDDSGSSPTAVDSYPAEINEEAKTITLTLPSCEQISETEVRYDPEGNKKTLDSSYQVILYIRTMDMMQWVLQDTIQSLYGIGPGSEECEVYGICEILKITSTSVTKSTDMSDLCAFDYMSATMFSEESDDGKEVIPDFTKSSCTSGSIYLNGKAVNITITEFDESTVDMTLIADGTQCRF